jgi:hypothetical protein
MRTHCPSCGADLAEAEDIERGALLTAIDNRPDLDDSFVYSELSTERLREIVGNDITNEKAQAYVDGGNSCCPWCDSEQIQGCGGVEVDDGIASQKIDCLNCSAMWTDIYTLTSISYFKNGEEYVQMPEATQ